MKRHYLAQALLVASLGAFAAAGYAETSNTGDKSAGSPGKTATQAGTGTTQSGSAQTDKMGAPMTSAEMRAYEQARAGCDAGLEAQRSQCWTSLTTKYSGVSPKCQKLTGNALDACIHQDAVSDNAGK
jgi:hypothetical protein